MDQGGWYGKLASLVLLFRNKGTKFPMSVSHGSGSGSADPPRPFRPMRIATTKQKPNREQRNDPAATVAKSVECQSMTQREAQKGETRVRYATQHEA